MEMTDQDIELPTDDLVEDEPVGAEDEAVRADETDGVRERLIVEDEDFEADQLDEAEAEELELAANEEAEAGAAEVAIEPERLERLEADEEEEPEEEREADLEEILRRQYGLGEEEPEPGDELEEAAGLVGLRSPGRAEPQRHRPSEFQCSVCFMVKATSQLVDPARRICIDCASNGTQTARPA
jgi:hypothetical protein